MTRIDETFRGKHVLITGAAGFIGSHMADRLADVASRLTLVDAIGCTVPVGRRGAAETVVVPLSILDAAFPALVAEGGFDYIFHLAGNANVGVSVSDPALDFEVNLRASHGMLEAMRRSGCRSTVVFASSAAVYGNPARLPVREEDATIPVSPYGVGKLAIERYLAVYCGLYGVRGASVRMFSPFGPRLRKQIVWELMRKLWLDPTHLQVLGDGTETRDFVYIDDLVSAVFTVAAAGALDGSVYNVARGIQTPISAIVEGLVSLIAPDAEIVYEGKSMPGYPHRWCGDVSRLEALGWKAEVALESGLQRTVEWFRHEHSQR